jgi:large subunit ribosomal protein L9
MANVEVVVFVKTGEENRIFGSVTPVHVAEGLAKHGIQADRRKIHINDEIKHTGVYTAAVKIHPQVTAEVKVRVEPETAEA